MRQYHQLCGNLLTKFLISSLTSKTQLNKGFTLIELLVVAIIVGIMAAVAVPVFTAQVGKSRESELLLLIGSMARNQQSYHYVYGEFALTLAQLEADSGVISNRYYDVDNITGDTAKVKIQAIPFNAGKDSVRNYAVGVYFNNGAYDRATCQGFKVGDSVQVGDIASDPCSNNGTKIY